MSFLKPLPLSQALLIIKTIQSDTSDNTTVILNKIFCKLIESNYHLEIIQELLLDTRINPSCDNNFAIISASEKGYVDIVKILLSDSRIDPTIRKDAPIGFASRNGHTAVVELLLKDPRVNPGADRNYAIVYACENNHLEIVKLLLRDSRVDPGAYNNIAIKTASRYGHCTEIVKLLLQDPRVDPSVDDNIAIKDALRNNNHLNIVKLLIPRIDLSTITDTKILDIAREINLFPKPIENLSIEKLKELIVNQMNLLNIYNISVTNGEMTYTYKL